MMMKSEGIGGSSFSSLVHKNKGIMSAKTVILEDEVKGDDHNNSPI